MKTVFYLIFAPTIICKIARSSSFEIKSSLSKSYILKATENNNASNTYNVIVRTFHLYSAAKILLYLHFSFCCLEFNRLGLFFLIGLKWARTCINCKKFTLSLPLSSKKAFTILSPRGFIANSGILRKSSLLSVPQSPRSKLVKRLYKRSIWFGVTIIKLNNNLFELSS